jgi:two-component system, chemotaxis family, chemotaxis protein CheY
VDGYGKRVLVVEDDENVRTGICVLLSGAAYNVYEARDGVEALDALKKRRYDVVLTQYRTPKELELLDQAQSMWPATPVILVSSDASLTDQVGKSLRVPAYAVLPKPFDSSDLLRTVRCATQGWPKERRGPTRVNDSRAYQSAA